MSCNVCRIWIVGIQVQHGAAFFRSENTKASHSFREMRRSSGQNPTSRWLHGFFTGCTIYYPSNAAAEGPVIIRNVSHYRSDAIILQRCRRSCHCSPNENLTNNSRSVVLSVCDSLRFTRQGLCETNFADIEKPLG